MADCTSAPWAVCAEATTDEGRTTGPRPCGVAAGSGVSVGNPPGVPDGATTVGRGRGVEGWVEADPVAATPGVLLDDVAVVPALDGEVPGGTLGGGAFCKRK